ncbi:hypothetical protein FNO01nite_08560 [Flavobacterium noncentrifugens]|uniref:Uncharacterized protein n=1 Tax=Flavobacterium noncentrifugens TaxID=1128970 RepID=A0A1G8TDG0_9FLAO|nr:hypothetical protein [Flavobacterium noncentrifugens]GEP50184.1 hypothetical protein FNO01nite_08560 [Flavobacterium noncentrifugens]SDJ39548.1 hypothetical protein SAMN04487935_0932 [Flavobacterium noncentrifugens]
MDAKKLKDKFIAEQTEELIDKLSPPFYALIDETIESVIDGSTSLDGKRATTEEEALTLIRYGVLARTNLFRQTILAAKKLDADNVTINYRGTSLKVK